MPAVNEFGDLALEQAENELGDAPAAPHTNEFGDIALDATPEKRVLNEAERFFQTAVDSAKAFGPLYELPPFFDPQINLPVPTLQQVHGVAPYVPGAETISKAVTGVLETAIPAVSSMTSPAMITAVAAMGQGGLPAKLAAGGFAGMGAKGMIEGTPEFIKAVKEGDVQAAFRHGSAMAMSAMMMLGAAGPKFNPMPRPVARGGEAPPVESRFVPNPEQPLVEIRPEIAAPLPEAVKFAQEAIAKMPETASLTKEALKTVVEPEVPAEAVPSSLKAAPVTYAGFQAGFGDRPGFNLYNLTEDISPKLVKGSTVTEASLKEAGFEIPESARPPGVRQPLEPTIIEPEAPTKPVEARTEQPLSEPVSPKTATAPVQPVKWTTATGERIPGTELYAGIPDPVNVAKNVASLARFAIKELSPHVRRAADAVSEIARDASKISVAGDYRKAVLGWSGKLQTSFGEASAAQKEITTKVPNAVRREGITNWIQAGGDRAILTERRDATKDPKLRSGYDAALSLTPEEIVVANEVKAAFDSLGQRGNEQAVLKSFRDNYVTQIWDIGKGPAMGSSRTLKDQFRFSKARTFDSYFQGEQSGYTPKTKDIAKILPVYLHEMNAVIAARQLVQEMMKGVASDGRPLVSPRGTGKVVDGPEGQAALITPKTVVGDAADYRVLENQPALNDWTWSTKDSEGNPIFLKADLALHPEAYARLKNVLGKSAIKEWYQSAGSPGAEIPKVIAKGIDMANAGTKRTMLGFFAPFHQVQEGTHAIGHRVNPFSNIPAIDLVGNLAQRDAAGHGLMLLPDRASANQFMEGFNVSGLVSRIPGIGPMADFYSNYLFHQYIPGLKYKTYEAILERNQGVYAKDLASGEVKLGDVKLLSAQQANAAYGHLNYADMARNPTMQHLAQLGMLAPDFLEARFRFAGQAIKGAAGLKVGREQLLALATLAIAQAALAYIGAETTGGEWSVEDPFEFKVGTRKYTMRSVPEDTQRLLTDSRAFIHNRLSPLVGKGAVQGLSGVDWRGQKVTGKETAKELASQPVPLTLRGLFGTSKSSLSAWEQLLGAAGIVIRRNNPQEHLNNLHSEWLKNHPDPKIRDDFERRQKTTYPTSVYADLDNALKDNNPTKAKAAIAKLRESGRKDEDIVKRMKPDETVFQDSKAIEAEFVKSLDANGKKEYDKAVAARQVRYQRFLKLADELKMGGTVRMKTAAEAQQEIDSLRRQRQR